ncbi:hypothetical protein MPTK1_6g09490 [Marchantia polymorpha subsp. ruderalis]|uniref:Uncharacterized protein n=2 Tax=Marchantia polymorpha TaxID=3197 RepID=A0AAF6BQ91_MARPO|nr:hypothetical protein MARPO_0152s0007 [Marchantia polymorpha]BBN14175.1 hypothetical protein Mp_6g09490 [Marchantia polymorpha subsp. ruderalis]|eukprot:PTQ28889.1 hypothetical protein MARPO_0152s0007 [Marchantia polymorpha]
MYRRRGRRSVYRGSYAWYYLSGYHIRAGRAAGRKSGRQSVSQSGPRGRVGRGRGRGASGRGEGRGGEAPMIVRINMHSFEQRSTKWTDRQTDWPLGRRFRAPEIRAPWGPALRHQRASQEKGVRRICRPLTCLPPSFPPCVYVERMDVSLCARWTVGGGLSVLL